VRGPEVSRRTGEIAREVEDLVGEGVIEVTLLGQNVNSYGRDLDGTPLFARLLRVLDAVPGLERVRFTSPHPKDFRADTVAAMAECDAVCEHIHLPLQSGSDSCLRRMKRAYTRAKYLDKIAMVRGAIPDVAITTDIIVGFPGETESEFEDTMAMVQEVGYDAAYTFQYSPRPMTAAASHPDQIPKAVVQERFQRLVELQESISLRRNEALLNSSVEVLVEGPSKSDPDRLSGRTRTNKLVHFHSEDAREGDLRMVQVTEARSHYLRGEEVGARPLGRASLNLPLVSAAAGCEGRG
jgi:tRNA-2-methylthio-N6-dimethylallyladenosine synthase